MNPLENFYWQQQEPIKSCLLVLRELILAQDEHITNEWKYGMPFFCYKGKMFCYLWIHKKLKQPYIGIVEGKKMEHPSLWQEKRSRMKIMLLNAEEDLPVETIHFILNEVLSLYKF